MVTLGLDASTSVIGYAILEDGKIIQASFVDISKKKTFKEKVYWAFSIIESDLYYKKPDRINLEDNLMGFSGPSNRKTLMLLSRWNGYLNCCLETRYDNCIINNINPSLARKRLFGKARIAGKPAKEFVAQEIKRVVPDLARFEKKNKKDNVDKRMGDVYDAMVMALN